MDLTWNLPKLNEEDFAAARAAGVWVKSGRLDDMASSLELSTDEAEIDDLKSVPDPWARPLLFNQALTTKGHIAIADARDQWRGLIALMGLRHFYTNSYILSVQTIDLDDTSIGNAKFRRVLKRLRPVDTLNRDVSWMRTGVITIRAAGKDRFDVGTPQAVGLMVPNCLLAPARGARKIKMAGVPWLKDGLRDPTKCDDIPGTQWVALWEYLGNIFERLQAGDIGSNRQAILDEIKAFADECKKKIESSDVEPYTPDYAGFSEGLPHPFYEFIANAPTEVEEPAGPSECAVRLNAQSGILAGEGDTQDKSRISGVILLDPSIAEKTLGKRAQDVRLFGKYLLGTVDQGGTRAAMERDAEREGYLVITPEQIFTSKLVRLLSDGRVDTHPPKWENYLLPISPLAMFLIDRDRIANQITIADLGNKFEVCMKLEMEPASPQAKPVTHTITRMYDKTTDVVDDDVPDDIVLWPNVGMEGWPWNFMRYSFNSKYEMTPRFATSMKSMADTVSLRAKDSREEAIALLKSVGSSEDLIFERMEEFYQDNTGQLTGKDGQLIAHRFRFTETEDAVAEQHILGTGADYLFLGRTTEDGGVVPAGCILLPERRAAVGQGSLDVAVDFGTTNTVVYLRSNGGTERMQFEPRVSRPIHSRLAAEDQYALDCVEYFPATDIPSPFPTVMYERSFALRGSGMPAELKNSTLHGTEDNIFFMPDVPDRFGSTVGMYNEGRLSFNLKWSTQADKRRQVQRFLRQIIMMSTVEALNKQVMPANINWHFSYPQAWNRTQAKAFKTSVGNAWKEIMQPVLGKSAKPDDHIDYETEGAAALRFFTDGPEHVNQAGRLVLMLDIGGGTTEIAIYHRDQTIWRSSFRLAGGDFFTRFLTQNPSIFSHFNDRGSSIQDVLDKVENKRDKAGGDNSLAHFIELYISQPQFNDVFSDSYPMFSDEPEGAGLLNIATVSIAGMFYYIGLVLRNLLRQGLVNEKDVENLTIAFAGRGSSFFSYLGKASSEDDILGQVSRMISDVVHAKTDGHEEDAPNEWELTHPRVRELFSTHPKHEVAHGMLCGEPNDRLKRARNAETPLGERVELRNGETMIFQSDQFVEHLPSGVSLDEVSDAEFNRFLELLEIRTGLKISLDSKGGSARDQINNDVDREFSRALGALERSEDDESSETLEIEPPFITKLRSLVHILSRNIEERQNLLLVKNGDPKW